MSDSQHQPLSHSNQSIEWPTLIVFALTYLSWLLLTLFHTYVPTLLLIISLSFLVALHSSLQHEVIHGHPTGWHKFNNALAFPALGLVVPYERYELLHLQHHRNWLITDPFDDSESYFLARSHWLGCSALVQTILRFNNTMFGRLLFGPAIMITRMLTSEYRLSKTNKDVLISWVWHGIGMAIVLGWLWLVGFPILLYVLGVAYPALSLLMVRSYGEHLPEENIDHRSAIIKSNFIMQFVFLNNNLHRVHHDHPEAAWYQLPALYNQHYKQHTTHVYDGYLSLFKQFGFKQRFPVEHPFLAKD